MRLDELLGIKGDIVMAEPSYQNNLHIDESLGLLHRIASDLTRFDEPVNARMIVIEDGKEAYALALYSPADDEEDCCETWTILTTALDSENQCLFEELVHTIRDHVKSDGVATLTLEKTPFKDAIREYYSLKLMENLGKYALNPESVHNRPRVERIKELVGRLKKSSGIEIRGKVIEICCGNGMATAALHELGIEPICVDNDPYSITEGLLARTLKPERTIVADATELSHVLKGEEFDTAIGFMLGDIDNFNRPIWKQILLETLKVTKNGGNLFFTVRTEPEARFIDETVNKLAVGKVIRPDKEETLYDRWIYIGKKK